MDALRELGYSFMIEHYNEMIAYDDSKFSYRNQFNLLAEPLYNIVNSYPEPAGDIFCILVLA